jgi:cytochrome c oxidase subunit 1
VWSLLRGATASENPWEATTLEWTVASPPPHGNFGDAAPDVHRWAYEYSAEGQSSDYAPQTVTSSDVPVTA